jgi:hypothetical protein
MALIPTAEAIYIATEIEKGNQGVVEMADLLEVARTVYVVESRDLKGLKLFPKVIAEINRYLKDGRVSPGCMCLPYKMGSYYKESKQ